MLVHLQSIPYAENLPSCLFTNGNKANVSVSLWKQSKSGQNLLVSGFWKIILEILRQGETKRKL